VALTPIDEIHALQIQAGTIGRKAGHAFEDTITNKINGRHYPARFEHTLLPNVASGDPADLLLRYICLSCDETEILSVVAISTGALATSEEGKKWLSINGANVRRCKSDLVLTLRFASGRASTFGVSTKQCNNSTPTNAQLYFTTARGFVNLLHNAAIVVSDAALIGLRKFCGDQGFRPSDLEQQIVTRQVDPRRYFWEEIGDTALIEWTKLFSKKQDAITRLLLQKAYMDDPFVPDFVLHKTKASPSWHQTEVAIYSIEELISLSRAYQGYNTRPYSVRKGSYRDPVGVTHEAPRFGIVQMQRGGQRQHPDQLQFNLEAGYFYKIGNSREQVLCDSES
jgi:hypothetical protein